MDPGIKQEQRENHEVRKDIYVITYENNHSKMIYDTSVDRKLPLNNCACIHYIFTST